PRSEAANEAIGWRAAEPHGGNRRPARRSGGSGSPRNQRYRRKDNVARNAAPTAIGEGMNSAHTGGLHDASSAVTPIQNRDATVKNTPSRNARLRLRISLARGSLAALSFSANTSDHSAAVSTPRCTSVRHASDRPARVFTALPYESYCDSGFS